MNICAGGSELTPIKMPVVRFRDKRGFGEYVSQSDAKMLMRLPRHVQ